MNTAEKLEYHEQMSKMVELNAQAFANTVWDDPEKAIKLHKFWKDFSHDASEEGKVFAKFEMTRIEATLIQMTTINVGFYGSKLAEHLDRVGLKPKPTKDDSIEDILPETDVVVNAETDLTEQKEEGGKILSLFNGEDMGDKPDQDNVSKAAKQLLVADREEDAIALAKQYLGTGNYTPRKPGAKTHEWKDKEIMSWIKTLKVGLSKSTPVVEKPKDASPEIAESFSNTKIKLEAEKHAFKDFAERYTRLATNGSEDAIAAEELAKLFFKGREYNDAQIQVWKETVTKNDDSSVLDHMAVLGAIGTDDNQLIISDVTYEDLNAKVYDMMQEIQITKDRLDDKREYMVEEVGRKLYDELINTCFTSESGATYEMYTKLHYNDFIEKIVGVNFTTLDSQATETKEAGQEQAGEASSSETKDTSGGVEFTIEEDQQIAMEKAKKKSSTGTTPKEVTLSIIKNFGVKKDIIDNPNYEPFFGKEHKFTTREALEKDMTEHFDEWAIEYKNSLTQYPLKEFLRAVDTAYFGEISFKDFVEEAKKFMVKPDGKVLMLFDKNSKVETRFPSVQDLEDYILGIYKINKNAEGDKAAQTKVQKDEPESGTKNKPKEEKTPKVEELKKETADTGSGEATKSVVESSSDVVVKVVHIENVCNKAVKKDGGLEFILKDRKISELVEKGGSIIGPAKDAKVEYDISAESLDTLRIDLQKIYDDAVTKKKPEKNADFHKIKKTVLDKVKQITSANTWKEATEKETSSISSLNDVKPAGLKLIKEGGTKKDLLKWGQDNLLNRKMKEQAEDKDVFNTAEIVENFMKGMFSDFFKEETPEETKDKKTADDLKNFIIAASKEEDATYIRVCKSAKDYMTENAIEIKNGDSSMFELVRENAVELYQAHLDKQSTARNASEEKVFVPEKISETIPEVWDKVKEFKTLGEIYAIALELCDAGDWQQALNITTELIKGETIENTKEWTDDMITQWFDINVLKKKVPASIQEAEVVEEVEDLDKNFKALQNANGGKSLRNAIIQILTDDEDSPELRKQIEQTIRGCKSNAGRRLAKASSSVIQGKINAAKLCVKPKVVKETA